MKENIGFIHANSPAHAALEFFVYRVQTWQTAACSMASRPPSGVSMLPEMR